MTRISDEKLVDLAVKAAGSVGADEAEGFLDRSSSTSVEVSGGKVESVKVREGSGVGVRVMVGDRLGFAHTSDLTEAGIKKTAEDAVANAEPAAPDVHNRLPEGEHEYPNVERYDSELSGIGLDERIDRAIQIEATALAYDKRITKVRHSTVSDSHYEVLVANSKGLGLSYKGTSCSASLLAVAEAEGEAQMGWDFDHSFCFRDLDVESVGKNAARYAVDLLGARQIDSTTVPVILDSPVASEFLAAVGHALLADQVQKGKSLFAGRVGEAVAGAGVTLIDDGALEWGIAPAPADGEGVPSQKTMAVESGVLKRFLHNTYTAGKDGVESTGNGVRSSYSALPEVGASNFYLVPGTVTRAELIEKCERAYLVTDVMGMHTVDMVSGDFSVGASGLWIEGGEIKFPVRETTIAGNVKDFLVNIAEVADDLKFHSRYGSPTIMVSSVVVSGK